MNTAAKVAEDKLNHPYKPTFAKEHTMTRQNMGGKYGTPGVATVKNIVRVNSRKDARR